MATCELKLHSEIRDAARILDIRERIAGMTDGPVLDYWLARIVAINRKIRRDERSREMQRARYKRK